MQALREEATEDPILVAAQTAGPVKRETPPFQGYRTSEFLNPMLPSNAVIATWYGRPAVQKAALALLRQARAFWDEPSITQPRTSEESPAGENLAFVEKAGAEKRVPIRGKSAAKLPSDAGTVTGLKRTLTLMGDEYVFVLMGLVLHLTDIKPYIEGQIAYSRELRTIFETACEKLGLKSGLGPYRQSFYYLANGKRAPWTLEPPSTLAEMKMNVARARFDRALQRELLGSDPRGELYRWVCDRLSSERGRPASDVHAAFEAATGVPSFVGSL